jgi:hypothetical protein
MVSPLLEAMASQGGSTSLLGMVHQMAWGQVEHQQQWVGQALRMETPLVQVVMADPLVAVGQGWVGLLLLQAAS